MPSDKPIAWSFSRLQTYRNCPYQYYRQNMVPKGDPDHINPYGGTRNQAMKEGDEMHEAFEHCIMYGTKLPAKYERHLPKINAIREKAGRTSEYRVSCEKQMAISTELKAVGWFDKNAWGRAQADVEIHGFSEERGIEYVDWKSGKPRSEWIQQGAAMAAVAFFVYPGLDEMKWRVEYVNYDETKEATFERSQINSIFSPILETTKRIKESDISGDWPTRPSGLCGWCAVRDCSHHPG